MKATLFCYRGAMLTSAALLFSVQPLVGKMVLPRLGGTPAVWTTCMLFFQAALLAGYAYAHGSTRWGVRRQLIPHGVLLLSPVLLGLLPLALPDGWSTPGSTAPAWWLLGLLSVAVGLPVFVVASTAPLLQRWFAETSHPTAGDPYYLYAASNLGSMAALLAYPVLIEPLLTLSQQAWLWAAGYLLLIIWCTACGAFVWRSPRKSHPPEQADGRETSLTVGERIRWIVLALVPSSWLLAVTSYMTADIAPVPLLWIVPLVLYLLSFMLVFARRPLPHHWVARVFPLTMIALAVSIIVPGVWPRIAIHLAAFFAGALFCHGELARRRPAVRHLTQFYLWMAVGGAAGGVLNALVAPVLFPTWWEFPLVVTAACLLIPRWTGSTSRRFEVVGLLILLLAIWPLLTGIEAERAPTLLRAGVLLVGLPVLMLATLFHRRMVFAGVVALVLACDQFDAPMPGVRLVHTTRSFFGVHRVVVDVPRQLDAARPAPRFRRLLHGTTQHGFQHIDTARACQPLAYYHRDGPLGDVFDAMAPPPNDPTDQARQQIAVVGLGVGTTACYAAPGRLITFYEIDATVRRLAENPRYFTYLSDCGRGRYEVISGDGRLQLARADDGRYAMILLDAFSSDAVPMHLLTREAVALYMSKLRDDGLLAFHVSNNHLDLARPLADVAADAGLVCLVCRDLMQSPQATAAMLEGRVPATYVVMARRETDVQALVDNSRWQIIENEPQGRVWSDDFSNIISALAWPGS